MRSERLPQHRSRLGRALCAVLLVAGCAQLIGAEESRVQGACASDGECAPGNSCLAGACRNGCGSDLDCDEGSRCLRIVDKNGCLPLDSTCESGCDEGTVCIGELCRTNCASADDCAGGQACQRVDAGLSVCVGTDSAHDKPLSANSAGGGGGSNGGGAGGLPAGEGGIGAGGTNAGAGGDGSTIDPCSNCTSEQACVEGTCKSVQCLAGVDFCAGTELRTCASDGLGSTLVETCQSGTYCDEETAECKPGVCSPGQPTCEGNRATSCNASGTGYLQSGKECTGQTTCSNGACTPWLCKPDTPFCGGKDVLKCRSNGLSSDPIKTCGAKEYCEEATAACNAHVCEPNSQTCAANTARKCKPDGSGFATTLACATSHLTCVAGECAGECAPTEVQCAPGNKVQSCDVNGRFSGGVPCSTATTCVDGTCGGSCGPTESRCAAGNKLQPCGPTGQYGAGSACLSTQTCLQSGKAAVCGGQCGPSQSQCKGTIPQTCDSGTWKDGSIAKGTCGAQCTPGGPTQCSSTLEQSCDPQGMWDSGKVVVGKCGAVCNPDELRCQVQIGQACSSTGTWASNGSSTLCTCWVPNRFRKAGPNLALDTVTNLTWEAALRSAQPWNVASTTCSDRGMRLPTTAEWEAVMIPTAQGANCQAGSPPFDGAGMPTAPADMGTAARFWTNEPEAGFPGNLRVVVMASSNFSWIALESDDGPSVPHLFRCVKP